MDRDDSKQVIGIAIGALVGAAAVALFRRGASFVSPKRGSHAYSRRTTLIVYEDDSKQAPNNWSVSPELLPMRGLGQDVALQWKLLGGHGFTFPKDAVVFTTPEGKAQFPDPGLRSSNDRVFTLMNRNSVTADLPYTLTIHDPHGSPIKVDPGIGNNSGGHMRWG